MRGWRGLLVALVALVALAGLRPRLQERQEAAGLVIQAADQEGMASDVAVPTLALGAFRGLIVDYLWIRTISLREQGRTYEARILAEQIGRLQPRLPAVWDYLGSHLAYDLAATAKDPASRWAWIKNGLDLLREQGLAKNPTSPRLCYTLSRIYQDKINATFDAYHRYFKVQHALQMYRAGVRRGSIAEIAAAPELGALVLADPEARAYWERYLELRQASAAALGEELPADPRELDPGLLVTRLNLFTFESTLAPGADPALRAEVEFLQRLDGVPAGRKLYLSSAAAALRGIGFDPEIMAKVDREYGPLDWLSSFSAPIYWSVQGMWFAEAKGDVAQEFRCRRVSLQALKNALRSGTCRLEYDAALRDWIVINLPNLELIPRLEELYLEGVELAKEDLARLSRAEELDEAAFKAAAAFEFNQHEARKDFLIEAIIHLSEYGQDTQGRLLLERARAAYPDEGTFQVRYEDYLMAVLTERLADAGSLDTVDSMTQGLLGLWGQAFTSLALGEDAKAETYAKLAQARLARWNAYIAIEAEEDPDAAARLSVDARRIQRRALEMAASRLPPHFRARLAERTGADIRQRPPQRPR